MATTAIDPNGLEVDGAGSIENSVSMGTLDTMLLMIWAALTLAMVGLAVTADRRPTRELETQDTRLDTEAS